jgi:hypothetical protein
MLAAAATRDDGRFRYWREQMTHDDAERRRLSPLLYEVFRAASAERFPDGAPAEQVRHFFGRPRVRLHEAHPFSAEKAERLTLSALGVSVSVNDISITEAVMIRIEAFTYLVEDLHYGAADIDALIADAEAWVATQPG